MPTLIFKTEVNSGKALGIISLKSICHFPACIDFMSKILSLSHEMKAFSIDMVVIMTQISIHITTVATGPDPNHNIIIGPSAILGREFRMIIYGSSIFRSFSLHHNNTARIKPIEVAKAKPIIVS